MKMTKRLSIYGKKVFEFLTPVKSIEVLIYEQEKREKTLKTIVDKELELKATLSVIESEVNGLTFDKECVTNTAKRHIEANKDDKAKQGYEIIKDIELKIKSLESQKETLTTALSTLNERRKVAEKVVRSKKVEIESLKVKNSCTNITNDVISIIEDTNKGMFEMDNAERDINIDSKKSELKLQELQNTVTSDTYVDDEIDFETWKQALGK